MLNNLKNISSTKKNLLKAWRYGDIHEDPSSLPKDDPSYHYGYWVYVPSKKAFVFCETSKQAMEVVRSIPLSEYESDDSDSDSDSHSDSDEYDSDDYLHYINNITIN